MNRTQIKPDDGQEYRDVCFQFYNIKKCLAIFLDSI